MLTLFVYGTLKPGEAYYEKFCRPYVIAVSPALAQGYLFHLPQGYPAMTAGEGWVIGALLHLQDDRAIADMDDFEDYSPHRPAADNWYVRDIRPVFSLAKEPLGSAWIYLMAPDRVQTLKGIPIANGNWTRAQWPSIAPA